MALAPIETASASSTVLNTKDAIPWNSTTLRNGVDFRLTSEVWAVAPIVNEK